MKKPLLICLTAFFIFPISCQYGTLVDGGGDIDNNYSVLGEVLSSTAVLPPSNAQSIISTGNGKYTVLLCWDSVPNAKEYSVSVSGDVEIKDERVSSPQYSFDVTLSGDSDFTAEATLKTINVNGKISAAGKVLPISFGSEAAYNEKVQNFFVSRGDQTSVKLTYSRTKDAESYYLERKQTGAPDTEWKVLVPALINPDLTESQYYYNDQTAVEGYRYDYRISPVNIGGIKGEPTVAEAGFVLPLVRNLCAGQGGEGIYASSGKKGIFKVSWEVQSVLYDYGDQPVEDEKLKEMLLGLSFQIRVAASATGLDSLANPNFTSQWSTVSSSLAGFSNYGDSNIEFNGLTKGTVFETLSRCTVYCAESTEETGLKEYYMYIIVDGTDSAMFRTHAFFQVRPNYGSSIAAALPWSNKAYGYVVSKAAADQCTSKVTDITAADAGDGTVQISWSGTSSTGKWALYAKKVGEAGFSYIGDATGTSTSVTFPFASGDYYFGVAATSGGEEGSGIVYSSADTVAVTLNEE